jgi:hypothetical protein
MCISEPCKTSSVAAVGIDLVTASLLLVLVLVQVIHPGCNRQQRGHDQ